MARDDPKSRSPRVRGSLRRRVLIGVLGLSLVPAALALAITYFSALGAIRATLQRQGSEAAFSFSRELDSAIESYVADFTRLLAVRELARSVRPAARRPSWTLPLLVRLTLEAFERGDQRPPIYFLGSDMRALAVSDGLGIQATDRLPDALELVDFAPVLGRLTPGAVLMMEGRGVKGAPVLWLLGMHTNSVEGEPLYLVVQVPIERLIEQARGRTASGSRDFAVFSQAFGVAYEGTRGGWASDLAKDLPRAMFMEASALVSTDKVPESEFACAPIRSLSNLTKDQALVVRWAVAKQIDLREIRAPLALTVWNLAMIGVGMSAVIGVFGIYASGRIVRPILELTRNVDRIANGDLDIRVQLRTGDELESLGSSINVMTASLAESYKRLADKLLQLDEKARQLELIHRISQSINRSLELNDLFFFTTQEIRNLIGVEMVTIALVDPQSGQLEVIHTYPAGRTVLPLGGRMDVETSAHGRVMQSGAIDVIALEGAGEATADISALASAGMRALCVVPLLTASGPLGVIAMADSQEDRFGGAEMDILERVAEVIALAIDHGRLFSRVSNFAVELEAQVDARTRELTAAQEKLIQTERFAATGRIASELAHEINNPLSIIKNYLAIISGQSMRGRPGTLDSEMVQDSLRVIEEEIDRITRIVAQLRQLNSPQPPVLKAVDLGVELDTLGELFRASFQQQQIALDIVKSDRIGTVTLCQDFLRQILINLLRNAADATGKGGRIVMRATDPEAGRFAISVEDNGCGIPAENLKRIFDPFFTTKREKGTGLGLSVSFGLATKMGGTLSCESTPGVGTIMTVTLPLSPPASDQFESMEEVMVAPNRRGGRIMLG